MKGINDVLVSLSPAGYEFPDRRMGDWHDLNWLRIAGKVETPDGSWSFNDPCMLTTEAAQLGAWLREAADGKVQPTRANAAGEIYPSCDFTEPNMGLLHGSVTSDLWCREALLEGCAPCPGPIPVSSVRT
jgi:hypothetical protein